MEVDRHFKLIKDNLQNIIEGKFNKDFGSNEIDMMLQISFILNYQIPDNNSFIFKYNDISISYKLYEFSNYNEILYYMRNEDIFKSCYKLFLRDYKLNKLLN